MAAIRSFSARAARLALLLIAALAPSLSEAQGLSRMSEGRNSARSPVIQGDTVTFRILPGDCQSRTYGDGRGESDCGNLNSKSYLSSGSVRVGSGMRYAFDIRVAEGLTHKAFHNPRAVPFTGGPDSRLSVAIWQGDMIRNHIVALDLDATRGLTFLGKRCAGPGNLSDWTRVEMLVKWTSDATGLMQVSCIGRVIHAVRGVATDQAPHCHSSNHCEPGKVEHPREINAGFGIFFDKEVVKGREMRPRVPQGGLAIQMRGLDVRPVGLK